ncbi:MAG: methyl-accepting chemotaxis protein [Hahellaceae bacterium]|nr:methyl-accepting chemotaxis protein [Hahellaceae bacterium]
MSQLLNFGKSRLLLPIFLTLVITTTLQAIIILFISSDNINALKADINTSLSSNRDSVAFETQNVDRQIEELNASMVSQASKQIQQDLNQQLTSEQETLSLMLDKTLRESATVMTNLFAALAPPLYWDNNVPELTRMVQIAHENENVVFAFFLDKDNNPLTRYLNRKDPRVTALLSASKERGSANKVIDAAKKDKTTIIIKQTITSNEIPLGTLILGLSNIRITESIEKLKGRFATTVNSANENLAATLTKESSKVVEALKQSNAKITQASEASLHNSNTSIDLSAKKLSTSLVVVVLTSATALLFIMTFMLVTRILLKINSLRDSIWDIAEGKGDLTQRARIKGNDEIANMAEGLNRFIASTQSVVKEVNHAALTAKTTAQDLSQMTQRAHGAVDSQTKEVDMVSSAVSEMASSIQQVAQSIHSAAEQVDRIKLNSNNTSDISHNVREQLDSLMEKIASASEVVARLDVHSGQIGSILDVIQGIAEQTNLLALNAAIEAARAGESGRGFAVVADEVRALASKTQQSTEEIKKSIDSLQAGSKDAVNAIHTASNIATQSKQTFEKTDELLDSVNSAVNQLSDMTTEISSMAAQQTEVSDEIHRNITNILEAAEDTAEQMLKASNSSKDIDSTVNELQKKVSRFKV